MLETGREEFDQQTITNQAGETIHTRNIIELDIMLGFLWIVRRESLVVELSDKQTNCSVS